MAAAHGHNYLILGAWGCGVFRNDPAVVAEAFKGQLRHGQWAGRFARVVFSILDTSPSREVFTALQRITG